MFRELIKQEKLHSAVKWLLVLVIVVPMMFFGAMWAGSAWRTGPGGKAGDLFGRAVPWEEYQQEYQLISRSLQAQMGTMPEAFAPFLRQQTWDRLILKAEAKRRIRISDEQVARSIQTQPTFHMKGAFSRELYYQFVRSIGTSPAAFEERVRDDLRLQQLTELVKAEATLTDEALKAAYAKTHERRRLAYVAFPADDFMDQARQGLTEQELRAAYQAHPDAVKTPARRRFEYVGLSFADALARVPPQPPSDQALQSYLAQHDDEFAKPDGSLPALPDVRARLLEHWRADQARQQLMDVSLDLQDDADLGMRFEELAAATGLAVRTTPPMSLPASDVERGPTSSMMRAAFEEPLGRMTRVAHEPSGVFVLRAIEETPSSIPPFEQVQEPVRRMAVNERARQAAKTKAVAVHDQLLAKRKAGLTVEESWLALELTPSKPAPVTREEDIEGVGHAPAVSDALFAAQLGETSDILETPQGYVIAVVEESLPFDEAQFAKEKERVRAQQLKEAQDARLAAWLADLRTRAHLKDLTAASKTPNPS